MGSKDRIGKVLSNVNVGGEELIGLGLEHFLSEQDPDHVEFTQHPNGYTIKVKTDEENIEKARQIWQEHVDKK